MTTPDPSREAFEKWAISDFLSVNRSLDGTDGYFEGDSHIAWQAWQAAMAHKEAERWQPIESAPKNKTILLGHRNSHGHWRTLRGEWFSQEEIDELWEDPDGVEPGWFETSVEADDVPNVWHTNPTHWQPLPAVPELGAKE